MCKTGKWTEFQYATIGDPSSFFTDHTFRLCGAKPHFLRNNQMKSTRAIHNSIICCVRFETLTIQSTYCPLRHDTMLSRILIWAETCCSLVATRYIINRVLMVVLINRDRIYMCKIALHHIPTDTACEGWRRWNVGLLRTSEASI
jgi:hypothetical protein